MKKTAILIMCLSMLTGCPSKENADPKDMKVAQQVYRVTTQSVQDAIDATGLVQPDREGGAKILSPIPGAVEAIFVKAGDHVQKGTPLVTLRSADTSDTYAGYLSSLSQLKQSERTYDLNKQLFEVGAITKNDLLISEANYEQSKASSEGLKKKLDIYGASLQTGFTDKPVIKAPIDGHIVDIQAHIGDRFDISTPLMTIVNPDKIFIVANIFDTDIQRIKKGREVIFATDVFPGKKFKGAITSISDVEDMDSKTIKTYIRILEGKDLLRQNMFLRIKIFGDAKILPTVPKTAIIYLQGKFYVRLKQQDKFELHEVRPVLDISESMMAVEGLKTSDEIAFSAIDLERP